MTTEQQKTFGDVVGMELMVPVGPHRDDIIECSDGTPIRRGDAEFVDCRGVVHSDEDTMNDANDDIVRELLDAHDEWIGEYVSSDDYGDQYVYCAIESNYSFPERVGQWLDDNYTDCPGNPDHPGARPIYNGNVRQALIDSIAQEIDEWDLEAHYNHNEYAAYSGDGCCLASFEVGEYESQVDIDSMPELIALNKSGDLEGCLEGYTGDLYLYRAGTYAKSGWTRDGNYVSHGCFTAYSTGWGVWHYVIPESRMKELLCDAIVDYCSKK